MIEIEYTNTKCKITSDIPRELKDKLSEECSFLVDGAEYMSLVKRGKWDGRKRLFHKGHKTFPTGLLSKVTSVLEDEGYRYQVLFPTDTETTSISFPKVDQNFSPREYQKRAIDTALDEKRCIIRMATGAGKTVVAGHLISEIDKRTVFFVHTRDLLYQAKDMFSEMLGSKLVGQIGDGVVDIREITICTIQTACRTLDIGYESYEYEEDSWNDSSTNIEDGEKIQDLIKNCGLVLMDECHRVAAPTAMNVLQSVEKAQYRYGLSASPWRDDNADLVLEAVFGEVAVEVDASELIRSGHLVKPIIRFVEQSPVFYGGKQYQSVYKDYIVENHERNLCGVNHAIRMIEQDMQVMILVRYIRHGEAISDILYDKGYPTIFLKGSDSTDFRNKTIQKMRDGSIDCIIATSIADEGLDMKPLSGLVLLGGGKSSVKALQRVGRVLRPYKDKSHAEVIDFMDRAKYLQDHSLERMKIYQTEQEFIITDV